MSDARTLRLFFHDQLLKRAQSGGHNYTNRISATVEQRGWSLELQRNSDAARLKSVGKPGLSLFHMDPPLEPNGLTTRLVYLYPFWRIEKSSKRWEWDVAQKRFDPDMVDPDAATEFFGRRKGLHLKGLRAEGDCVFVPLQGRLQEHRSFQTMSPLAMLGETLAHTGDRRVLATLHPKEVYSASERAALEGLAALNPRLIITDKPLHRMLKQSNLVVTQNSSVALLAYLLGTPVVLFGQIDFHHVALNVAQLGVAEAFRRAPDHRPDYARYLHWFFKQNAIDAAADNAEAQILERFHQHGWAI